MCAINYLEFHILTHIPAVFPHQATEHLLLSLSGRRLCHRTGQHPIHNLPPLLGISRRV
jgi:hypothetical protein